MKIQYNDEGACGRVWITGPFWQLFKARLMLSRAFDDLVGVPISIWQSTGLTFQITLYGKSAHALRAYKSCLNNR